MIDATNPELDPLLVIAGPTASGKSLLALEVAEALGGEVVSADAFAVYRGLDIGTDKPDAAARRRVRHHLVDIADPQERFSAGAFASAARDAISEIRGRGRTAVVAGGSNLYLRALLLGLFPSPQHDPSVRAGLVQAWRRDPSQVLEELRRLDPQAAERIGPRDRQRVLRALEIVRITGVPISAQWRDHPQTSRYRALIAVPERPRDELYARIDMRVDRMFQSGLEEEVNELLASGVPTTAHAFKAIGYRQVVEMIEGLWDRTTAIERTKRASRNLAKRQLTWLRSSREGVVRPVPPVERGGTEALIGLWDHHIRGRGAT